MDSSKPINAIHALSLLVCQTLSLLFSDQNICGFFFFTLDHWSSDWSVEQMLTLFCLVRHTVSPKVITQDSNIYRTTKKKCVCTVCACHALVLALCLCVCVCVERWRWRKWVTGWIWSQRMDLTAPVSDLCQTEMLKVTGALAPRRVHDQPGIWRLFQNQACRLLICPLMKA